MAKRKVKIPKPILVQSFGKCAHDIVIKPSRSSDFVEASQYYKTPGLGTFTSLTAIPCGQIAMKYSRRKVTKKDIISLKAKVCNST
jgi:hypothetical protein